MLSIYDKLVIAFYFAFMTGIAFVMKRFIRNTSDYFRGGGEMLWWMSGAGAFVVSFSAVVFTGMAGKAYSDGPVVLMIYIGNAIGFIINIFWFAPISRQTRRVTAMQVVRDRFGGVSEQFFTWLYTPVDFAKEEGIGSDNMQARIMGTLCMLYGGFILMLLIIPNPPGGRIAIAFCGVCMEAIGVALRMGAKGKAESEQDARSQSMPQPAGGFEPVILSPEARDGFCLKKS